MNEPQTDATWEIRAYQPGDEQELVALFQRVFGRPITTNHWHWKVKQPPSPVETVWLSVDTTSHKPIFQYAGIPVRYQLPNGPITGMVSVDTMASPDYRRQGFLTKVGRFTYDTWRKGGIPFVIGLPNNQWGSRTVALGWQVLFPLHWLRRPLHLEAFLARRMHLPFLKKIHLGSQLWEVVQNRKLPVDTTVSVRPVQAAGSEFDVLWERCRGNTAVSAIRDAAWVQWRFLDAPQIPYQVALAEREQPVGYIVYHLETQTDRTVGIITELLVQKADDSAAGTLMNHALTQFRQAGAETAVTQAVPDTWLYTTFRRAGFFPGQQSFTVQLVPLSADLPLETLRQAQNWTITGGDFDII